MGKPEYPATDPADCDLRVTIDLSLSCSEPRSWMVSNPNEAVPCLADSLEVVVQWLTGSPAPVAYKLKRGTPHW